MATPVEVWAPAFAKILPEELTPEAIFAENEDWRVPLKRWCRLCETYVPFGEREAHAREHDRERRQLGKMARRDREREAAGRLRETNKLKREGSRALGDGSEAPSSSGRPTGQTSNERSTIMATAATETAAEKASGQDIFRALLGRIGSEKVGKEVKVHPKGVYARVFVDDKRHAGYVVAGKTKVNVYPQALAADMPKDLGFKKVKLGSHHYGRGEVIVPVDGEDDFDAAIAALKAAATKVAASSKADGSANGKAQASPDPKKKSGKRQKKAAAKAS